MKVIIVTMGDGYVDMLEPQVKNLEETEGIIIRPYLGRSVWEDVVEALDYYCVLYNNKRACKLKERIMRLM